MTSNLSYSDPEFVKCNVCLRHDSWNMFLGKHQFVQEIQIQPNDEKTAKIFQTILKGRWDYNQSAGTLRTNAVIFIPRERKLSEFCVICDGVAKISAKCMFPDKITDCEGTFGCRTDIKRIEGLDDVDTSCVVTMRSMFEYCRSLESIDLSKNDMKNVENMMRMFYGCASLKSIDFGSDDWSDSCANDPQVTVEFNTRNVTNLMGMFDKCESIETLDLSIFRTERVFDMSYMFNECKSLQTLDLSRFETLHVGLMSYMFNGCKSLKTLDVSNFNTKSVKNMENMFHNCESLESLDLSTFDTSNVVSMVRMFKNCNSLKSLKLSEKFKVAPLADELFLDCEKLSEIWIGPNRMKESARFCAYLPGVWDYDPKSGLLTKIEPI